MILNIGNSSNTLKVPTLNSSYPADTSCTIGESVSFSVVIEESGYPNVYGYEWYVDGVKYSTETTTSFSFIPPSVGSHTICCVVTNEAGSVQSRLATITVNAEYIFKNGVFLKGGGYSGSTSSDTWWCEVTSGGLWYLGVDGSGEWGATWATVPVNVSNKNKLIFTISSINTSGSVDSSIGFGYFGVVDGSNLGSPDMTAMSSIKLYDSGSKEISVDISNLSNNYYVKIVIDRRNTEYHQDHIHVSSIRFE